MNELARSIYLQSMGIDAYVSRHQLPGAATTKRLAITRSPSDAVTPIVSLPTKTPARDPAPRLEMPRLETAPAVSASVAASPVAQNMAADFSLTTISCGGWLWLEEMEDASRLDEQLLLVQSMAEALGVLPRDAQSRGSSSRFDWPIHNNRQLDQGDDAARSSVTGFIQRKLDQLHCQGLVLLGSRCAARVSIEQLDCGQFVHTVSTAQMLQNPLLKRQAWQDLRPVLQPV